MVIDDLLKKADWDIFDKSQVSTEETAAEGFADYVLKDSLGRPICIIEAKRFSKDPYSAKTQAKAYAEALLAPFVILSNGSEHYFWDYGDSDARPIIGLPTRLDLQTRANLKIHRKGRDLQTSLAAVPFPERFQFKGESVKSREYQLKCLEKADVALSSGRRRMLFEMATGTGKTLTIAMLIKRWFQAAAISRVLFLVDRIELAKQAKETFDDYLREYPCTILFGGKKSLEGQIVVGTLDTIASQLGPSGFGHAYFDLVVTDECHRSIYKTHRATLGHFDAVHIGLTATPDPGELRWISNEERQLVRNTYMFFDSWDSVANRGRPTFAYTIQEGMKEGHLAPYTIYLAQTQLSVEGTDWNDEDILASDWGKNAESEDRLKLIIEEFYRVEAERWLLRPRKTIVFACTDPHADIIVRLMNKLLPDEDVLRMATQLRVSPGAVREGFAQKITCYANNCDPKPIINAFKYDPLPVIAVSVDMLDTGYDQKDIETLVMLRPTNSAIKFAQMRGRGSRTCPKINKEGFLLYDFVGNTIRFDDHGTDFERPREVARVERVQVGEIPVRQRRDEFVLIPEGEIEDVFVRQETITIGPHGLAIDRRTYQDQWSTAVSHLRRTDPIVQKIFAREAITEEEWESLRRTLDSPDFYFNESTLRKAFEQPSGSLTDFILSALGEYKFPTREERISQAFDAWVAEHSASIEPEQAHMLRLLKNRVLAGDPIEIKLFSQAPFSIYGGRIRMEQLFGKEKLGEMVDELNSLFAA